MTIQYPATLQLRQQDYTFALLLLMACAVGAALVNFFLDGPFILIVAICGAGVVLVEPRLGLYAIGALMAADSVPYDPVVAGLAALYEPIPGGFLALPVELLVAWTFISWALRSTANAEWRLPRRETLFPMLVLWFLLFVSMGRGITNGGDFNIAFWETRALLTVLPVAILTSGLIRTRQQLYEFLAIIIIALAVMTLEQGYRYLAYTKEATDDLEQAFSHDGAMLVAAFFAIGVALVLWGENKRQRFAALLIVLLAGGVLLVSRRRAGLIGAEAGLVVALLILMITNWRRFTFVAPIVVIVSIAYMAMFWNNPNSLGQPVRAFRSVFDQNAVSERDRSSDEYRQAEKLNVWSSIQANPVQGLGFGTAYPKPYRMVNLSVSWPFWDQIPHNNVLWLWLKGGIATFIAFWFFIGMSLSETLRLTKSRDPALTTIAATIAAFLVMMILFAYVDLGLTRTRMTIGLGICIGLITVLSTLWRSEIDSSRSRAAADDRSLPKRDGGPRK